MFILLGSRVGFKTVEIDRTYKRILQLTGRVVRYVPSAVGNLHCEIAPSATNIDCLPRRRKRKREPIEQEEIYREQRNHRAQSTQHHRVDAAFRLAAEVTPCHRVAGLGQQ